MTGLSPVRRKQMAEAEKAEIQVQLERLKLRRALGEVVEREILNQIEAKLKRTFRMILSAEKSDIPGLVEEFQGWWKANVSTNTTV